MLVRDRARNRESRRDANEEARCQDAREQEWGGGWVIEGVNARVRATPTYTHVQDRPRTPTQTSTTNTWGGKDSTADSIPFEAPPMA
jgi:hypothetical protein